MIPLNLAICTKYRKTLFYVLLLVCAVFLLPAIACAEDNVYYTFGGFRVVDMAFDRIASIMALVQKDPANPGKLVGSAYIAIVGGFIMLSWLFGIGAGLLNALTGKSPNIGMSYLPIIFGVIAFLGLVVPKKPILVYDPVLNQQSIATHNIPVGVYYPAMLINKMERMFIELYDNSATQVAVNYYDSKGILKTYTLDPLTYEKHGGAISAGVLADSMNGYNADGNSSKTMYRFVQDCAIFEMMRPGGTLTQQDLISPPPDQNLITVLENASSLANWTVSYMGGAPATGNVVSCKVAYDDLKKFYITDASSNSKAGLTNACTGNGFEIAQYGQCQTILTDLLTVTYPGSGGVDPSVFLGNMAVANITQSYFGSADPQTAASFLALKQDAEKAGVVGALSGVVNPRMIDAYVAYSFFLIPVLCMFIPTHLGQKAFTLMLSLMLWTMLVRVLDVVCFHLWANEYYAAVSAMGDIGQGVASYFRLPMESSKHLKAFADLRSSVFLLATAVSGAMFKFGDSAMSRLASQAGASHSDLHKTVDSGEREKGMREIGAGAHRAQLVAELAGGAPWTNSSMMRGQAFSELSGALGGQASLTASNGNAALAAGQAVHTGAVSNVQANSKAAGTGTGVAQDLAALDADKSVGGMKADKAMFNTLKEAGLIGADTTMRNFQQQLQSGKGVVLADGSNLLMRQGADGSWQAAKEGIHNGYTSSVSMSGGKEQTAKIANGDAWAASFGADGQLLATNNRALSGAVQQSLTSKSTQVASESFGQQVTAAKTAATSNEHSVATQTVTSRAQSYAKEVAKSTSEKLAKTLGLSKDETQAVESAIGGKLSADPIKTAGFIASLIPGGQGVGVAAAGLSSLASGALGLKSEINGQIAKKSGSATKLSDGLSHANEDTLQNALKESIQESVSSSKTIGDIKKDALSKTYTNSAGQQVNYGNSLSVDSSNGVSVRADAESAFIRDYADKNFSNIKDDKERIAAANNELASRGVREPVKLSQEFGSFMDKIARGEGSQITTAESQMEASKNSTIGMTSQQIGGIKHAAENGQGLIKGPGPGPKQNLAHEVLSSTAQAGADISGSAEFMRNQENHLGITNFNPPKPTDYTRGAGHPVPSVTLGNAQLKTVDGQPTASVPTSAENVEKNVKNGANAVYQSPPVQVGVQIVGGLVGAAPEIMKGLNTLSPH